MSAGKEGILRRQSSPRVLYRRGPRPHCRVRGRPGL